MEAKLERERGNPAYVSADGTAKGGVETAGGKKGKRERIASNEMCTFLILNISSKMNFLKNVKIYLAKIMFIEIISINLLII